MTILNLLGLILIVLPILTLIGMLIKLQGLKDTLIMLLISLCGSVCVTTGMYLFTLQ